jgi:hypothetical protein
MPRQHVALQVAPKGAQRSLREISPALAQPPSDGHAHTLSRQPGTQAGYPLLHLAKHGIVSLFSSAGAILRAVFIGFG